MAKVVIFGTKDTAQLANYYIERDTEHEVVAFTVHHTVIPNGALFCGKPVVPWEEVENAYTPRENKLFVPMTGREMNKIREKLYWEGKTKGYEYISYVSPHASVCDNEIGENCFIQEDNTLQPFTKIGNNVVMWAGNHIGHHGIIRDHVFFTSHVVLSGHCDVGAFSWFGVNSTIRDGLTIGEGTFVAAGALVTKNTTQWRGQLGAPSREFKDSLELNP
tara:strand:- start:2046 stop:2702 length:657 start_codon:yes stop_codon:yes gene_type:complete